MFLLNAGWIMQKIKQCYITYLLCDTVRNQFAVSFYKIVNGEKKL